MPIQVAQSITMQPADENEFTHCLHLPLNPRLCTTEQDVRRYGGVPNEIDIKIVAPPNNHTVTIYVRRKDWQEIQARKMKYSPNLLAVTLMTAYTIGIASAATSNFLGATYNFNPHLQLTFIFATVITGTILLTLGIRFSWSRIFDPPQQKHDIHP